MNDKLRHKSWYFATYHWYIPGLIFHNVSNMIDGIIPHSISTVNDRAWFRCLQEIILRSTEYYLSFTQWKSLTWYVYIPLLSVWMFKKSFAIHLRCLQPWSIIKITWSFYKWRCYYQTPIMDDLVYNVCVNIMLSINVKYVNIA